MNLILNIDTAVQTATVCLALDEQIVGIKINPSPKDHAAWLHIAIKELMDEQKISLQQLKAIAISAGPGSYTGLRVAMATAKGLCYALKIPLLTVNTLQMMAAAALKEPTQLLVPMIDARRMEVFTAVFDKELNEVQGSHNIILNENSFEDFLQKYTITFFGNGSNKFESLLLHPNAVFKNIDATAVHLAQLSYPKFIKKQFTDLPYSEPFYGKEFYSPPPKAIL